MNFRPDSGPTLQELIEEENKKEEEALAKGPVDQVSLGSSNTEV
jgi:hypothetical protein